LPIIYSWNIFYFPTVEIAEYEICDCASNLNWMYSDVHT
jgi:hypothetical protein